MNHPLNTSPIYDALRQSIYDRLAGRVRAMDVVLREAKQETQVSSSNAVEVTS